MEKLVTVLVLALFIPQISCARPNYQVAQAPIQTGDEQKVTEDCSLKLNKYSLCTAVEWQKMPTEDVRGTFTLKFWEITKGNQASGPFITPPEKMAVVLWMPSMGHGSAPVKITEIQPGVYEVSEVYFVMSGDWEIRIQIKKGRDVLDQAALPIYIN